MISAEEARKMLIENLKSKTNEEIKKIKDKIKIAISKNESGIIIHPSVAFDTKCFLMNLGYDVENHCQWNETYTTIHW